MRQGSWGRVCAGALRAVLAWTALLGAAAFAETAPAAAPPPAAEWPKAAARLAVEEVVRGKLTVRVYAQTIAHTQCWTYVTDGLRTAGQSELVVSLEREPGEAQADWPRTLLLFLKQVRAFAEQKQVVGEGGFTVLSAESPPLVPGSALRAVLYTAPEVFEGIPVERPFLTAVLVSREEGEAAQRFGMARILARLGDAVRYFPTPPWSTRHRPAVNDPAEAEQSILGKRISRMPVQGGSVRTEAKSKDRTEHPGPGPVPDAEEVLHQETAVLRLTAAASAKIGPELARLPAQTPFALLFALDGPAGAAYVWRPGQTQPKAITRGGETNGIGGSFVLFTPSETEAGAHRLEDGFAIWVPPLVWPSMIRSLSDGAGFSLAAKGQNTPFEFRPEAPGKGAAGGAGAPGPAAHPSFRSGNGVVTLLVSQKEFRQRIQVVAFTELLQGIGFALEQAAKQAAKQGPLPAPLEAHVTSTVSEKGDLGFVVATRPPSAEFAKAAYEQLKGVHAPDATGEVVFSYQVPVSAQ